LIDDCGKGQRLGFGSELDFVKFDFSMSPFVNRPARISSPSTLLRPTSIASRRSLGNTSRVTMAVSANNRGKRAV
jgi:hypothetical protein